jgi:PAS domain S-box-containing protein
MLGGPSRDALQQLFGAAAAAMQEGLLLLDGRGAVVYANPGAEQILGRGAAELLGGPFPGPAWPGTCEDGTPLLSRDSPGATAIRTGRPCAHLVMGIPRPDGALVWLSTNAAPMPSSEGAAASGAVVTFRDVTQERDGDRAKGEFVSQVSHELRTPLTAIKGHVELLLDDPHLTDEQRESLRIVRQNADRGTALISDLLDLTRIETGRLRLALDAVNLRILIKEVVASFKPLAEEKNQEIWVDVPPTLRSAWGDPRRVTQVLSNLLSNAHKYTPPGGQIRVTARDELSWIRTEVRDTGIGISPEDQRQLFRSFFRASNRVTREAGGTGLGLALSRSLVELQGGRLTCVSEPGLGSTFAFTLPLPPPLQQRLRHVDW